VALVGCSSSRPGSSASDAGAESDGGGASSGGSSFGNAGLGNATDGGRSGSSSVAGAGSGAAGGNAPGSGSAGSAGATNAGAGGAGSPGTCDGVTCDAPPAAECVSSLELRTYDVTGTCQAGSCDYLSHSISCSCGNAACSTDPCLEVSCNSPPASVCMSPSTLTTFASIGACDAGSCSYQATTSSCTFGCQQGACKPDPCDAVTCNQPPAATCKDSGTQTSFAPTGTCSAGACSYDSTDIACDFGCKNGACQADPCAGVVCNQAPAASCSSASELKTYDEIGACTGGVCGYTSHVVACDCGAGACNVDPCQSVTCSSPPPPSCKTSSTLVTYAAGGTCSAGTCSYGSKETACAFGCAGGACHADPCASVTCDEPPPAVCKDSGTLTTYAAAGTCSGGICSYAPTNATCQFGCANGACKPDPCSAVACGTPPSPVCKDALTKTSFSDGSCNGGNCGYTSTDSACAFGCSDGACQADPCASVVCNQAPAATCKSEHTKTTYAGACSQGSCSYTPTDTTCGSNKTCAGAGVCSVCKSDASCGSACTACTGSTPRCADQGGSSACVACVSNDDCGGTTPKCNTATNTCGPPPSCIGLAKTCGATGDQDCCAANHVAGGDFNRNNDETFPATVSDFRLDNYEVSVGRFRKFVAVYQRDMIANGTGKNPRTRNDPGWSYKFDLSVDQAALKAGLKCDAKQQTWTDSAGNAAAESLPINCLNWYEAFAFCIWDGGRLPSEAEWSYASAGGSQQRPYAWGGAAADCSYANFFGAAGGTAYCVAPGTGAVSRVGSYSPKGSGLFGQADLAGNVGEWLADYSNSIYPHECVDCIDETPSLLREIRGGSFADTAPALTTNARYGGDYPSAHRSYTGVRCVRIP
jgi:formylglycine-generating enzyme